MNLVRFAIDRPIAVIAAVLMVVLFGLVALETIPIQLTPDVRKPVITVQTLWPGAAPAEVEREVVNRQEEVLKGVEGLEEVESRSEKRARAGHAHLRHRHQHGPGAAAGRKPARPRDRLSRRGRPPDIADCRCGRQLHRLVRDPDREGQLAARSTPMAISSRR